MSDAEQEVRAFPRYEVYAAATVRHGEELLILEVKNVSLGGLFILADEATRAHFPVGSLHHFTLLAAHEDGEPSASISAFARRHEPTGLAFMLVKHDDTLQAIIERMRPRP